MVCKQFADSSSMKCGTCSKIDYSSPPLVGGDIYHKSFHNLITIDATEKL